MKKALFLDRDGVINIEKNYVYRIEDFEFIDGIFDLVRVAQQQDYLPVIITNQAGIGRGYYGEDDFQLLTQWMIKEFSHQGVDIAAVYHCPYHETAGIGEYKKASFDRKPNPGMLLRARDDLQLDLEQSSFIGDKWGDLEAGKSAGVETLVLYADTEEPTTVKPGLEKASIFSSLSDITAAIF